MARRGGSRRKGYHLSAAHKAAISRALKGKKRGRRVNRGGTVATTKTRGRKTVTRKKYAGKRPGIAGINRTTYTVKSKKKNPDGSVTVTRSVRQRKMTGKQLAAAAVGAAIGGSMGARYVVNYQNHRAKNFKTIKVKKVTKRKK